MLRRMLVAQGIRALPLALRMGTTGNGNIQRFNRYKSTSPTVISTECDIAQEMGIVGFIQVWNGPSDIFLHESMLGMWEECSKRKMRFAIMLDKWVAANEANPTTRDKAVCAALLNVDFQKVLQSPAYIFEKYVLEFDLKLIGVDVPSIQKLFKFPILSEGIGYSWPNAASPWPVKTLQFTNALPGMRIPSLCLQFNDAGFPLPDGVNGPMLTYENKRDMNRSVWGTGANRTIDAQGGNYFFDQIAVTPVAAKYLMLVTWDDFEEGTALLHFFSMLTGKQVK